MAASSSTASTDSDDATTTTNEAAGSDDDASAQPESGQCTLEISGDHQESLTFEQDPTSVSTDYWLNEQTLRELVDELGEFAGGSYEELTGRGEPILNIVQISCGIGLTSTDLGATVVASRATRTTDLPIGPGSYPISGGLFVEGPAAAMGASVVVPQEEAYDTVPDSGSVEITRWDSQRIEGSFSFTALQIFADDPKEIEVAVQFSFLCDGVVQSNC